MHSSNLLSTASNGRLIAVGESQGLPPLWEERYFVTVCPLPEPLLPGAGIPLSPCILPLDGGGLGGGELLRYFHVPLCSKEV